MRRSLLHVLPFLVIGLSVQGAQAQRRPRPTPTPPPAETTPATTPPVDTTENDTLARNHFEAGRAYFSQARYDDAAREFAEAYRLSHRSQLLLNVARALEEADRETEAVAALDEWLANVPEDDPARVEVTQRRARLVLEAERRAAAEARPISPPPPTPVATEPVGPSPLLIVGISSLGLSAVAAGVSLGTGIAAHNIHEDLEAICDADGNCPASASSDISRGQALARASTAMTFIGIAAAGAGVALILVGRGGDEEPSPVTFVPWISPGIASGPSGAGAELQLSF